MDQRGFIHRTPRDKKAIGSRASGSLAAANLSPTIPSTVASALNITREWAEIDGDLALQFTITNNADRSLEIGSLGLPAEFNSIFTSRSPEDTQAKCSLSILTLDCMRATSAWLP